MGALHTCGPRAESRRRRSRTPRHFVLNLCVAIALLGIAGSAPGEDPWRQAIGPREWSFPRDHGAHPEYRTEWWYFTGNLESAEGDRYGYQLTFFRVGIRKTPQEPGNPWSIRDIYLGHFAVTDVARQSFRYEERVSREGPGLAGASTEGMEVWLFDWSARMEGETIRLAARGAEAELDLILRPRKPVVLHGRGGLSRKGPAPGQASYYASFTDLETRGVLRVAGAGRSEVRGTSWFDQEFGSNQLSEDQAGWDWFSVHLSDGRDLMLYRLRLVDGTVEPASSGTLVEADGSSRHLDLESFSVEVLDRWESPRTGARYPSRWRVRVPEVSVDLVLEPLVPDQELVTEGSTGVVYWEGAVAGEGISGGDRVTAEGYVELTGYSGTLGGLF